MLPSPRWALLPAVLLGLLAWAGAAPAAQVKDGGGFFSEEAVKKADDTIKQIQEKTGRDLLVETFKEIPEARKKDYKPQDKKEFFRRWATDNARERKVYGVYVLLCKEPGRLQIEVGRNTARRAFRNADRDKLSATLLPLLKEKKYDEALAECVAFVAARLEANANIKDEGGFFGKEAVQKAVRETVALERRYDKELVVETFKAIPEDLKKDYTPEKRNEFFTRWARDRARKLGVNGVYVLLCREPGRVQVEVGNETAKKAFTLKDRDKLAKVMLEQFKDKKFDEGLAEGLKFVADRLKANLGEKSTPAPGDKE